MLLCLVLLQLLLSPSPSFGQAESIEDKVNAIFYDVRITEARKPYVESIYAADLQRLIKLGPDAVPTLIRVVQVAPIGSMRLSLAIDALGHHRDPRALPCLIEAISYGSFHPYNGYHALSKALARFGEDAIEPLAPLAKSGPKTCRYVAMKTLKLIGGPQVEKVCIEVIRQADDVGIRWRQSETIAMETIGQLADPKHESLLLTLLSQEVREPVYTRYCEAIITALGTTGISEKGNAALIQILKTKESNYRKAAAKSLGKRKATEAIPVLIQLLDQESQSSSVGNTNGGGATPPIVSLQEVVIEVLAGYDPEATSSELIEATSDLNSQLGRGALSALSKGKHPQARNIFVEALQNKVLGQTTRLDAVRGLKQLADPSTIDALVSVCGQLRLRKGDELAAALSAIGQPVRPKMRELLNDPSHEKRILAISVLCRIADKRDFKSIAKAVGRPDTDLHQDFLALTRLVRHPDLDTALWELAKDATLSYDAFEILAGRPNVDRKTLQNLIKVALAKKPRSWYTLQLLFSLEKIGIGDCSNEAIALLKHERDDVREVAAKVLAKHELESLVNGIAQASEQPDAVYEVLLQHEQSKVVQQLVVKLLNTPEPNLPLLRALGKDVTFDPNSKRWPGASDVLLSKIGVGRWGYCPELIASAMAGMGDARAIDAVFAAHPDRVHHALCIFGRRAMTKKIIAATAKYPNSIPKLFAIVGDESVVESLIQSTRGKINYHWQVGALGKIGGPKAADFLLKELARKRPVIGTHEAVMNLDRNLALERLIKMLDAPSSERFAVFTLGQFATPAGDQVLRMHLQKTTSKEVRDMIQEHFAGLKR